MGLLVNFAKILVFKDNAQCPTLFPGVDPGRKIRIARNYVFYLPIAIVGDEKSKNFEMMELILNHVLHPLQVAVNSAPLPTSSYFAAPSHCAQLCFFCFSIIRFPEVCGKV